MYLIIERENGVDYAYFEDKKQFKAAQKDRENSTKLLMTRLDDECDLSSIGDNFYIVVPVKKKKLIKQRKSR